MRNRLVYILGGILAVSAAQTALAEAKPNPYQAIIERNPFGLKPPPPPPEPAPVTPATLPGKVILTGITTMFGPTPRALLEITEQEPGKTAATRKPILREGERDGAIEVVSIDLEKSVVKIRNAGLETNITFDTPKLTATAPPLGIGGIPPPPLTTPFPPGAIPQPNAQGRSSGVTIVGGGLPAASVPGAIPPNPAAVPPAYIPPANPTAPAGGLRTIPSRSPRSDGSLYPTAPGGKPTR